MNPDHLPRLRGQLRAAELHGGLIGEAVSFDWELRSGKTFARITGQLREVSHTQGQTLVYLCSLTEDTGGETDEFVLTPGTMVTVGAAS